MLRSPAGRPSATRAEKIGKAMLPALTLYVCVDRSGLLSGPANDWALFGLNDGCGLLESQHARPAGDSAMNFEGIADASLMLGSLQSSLMQLGLLKESSGSSGHGQRRGASELAVALNSLNVKLAEKSEQATGGVYFIPCDDDAAGTGFRVVFKPQDEENPTTSGQGFLKEYAAFVLDGGLSGIPETTTTLLDMGTGKGPQLGSVQLFLHDFEDAEDYGPGVFAKADVEKVGVLDIRLLNMDRHSSNLMRHKKTGQLVPIDHGSSFPELDQLDRVSFEWLQYPQAKLPFSEEMLAKIEAIDVEADLEKLQLVGLSEGSLLGVWMSTVLLQEAASMGKTLFEIGSMVQRQGDRSKPSVLETLFEEASKIATGEDFCDAFLLKLGEYLEA